MVIAIVAVVNAVHCSLELIVNVMNFPVFRM